jgi:4-hydroxy-3-methylbut-2-enyl diphosphate reductase
MGEWIDIQKDGRHVARERAKARELRKSAWWRQHLQRGVCHYCGKQVGAAALTLDHVVPVARGGTSTKGNVVPACAACNAEKSHRTPAERILEELENAGRPSKRLVVVNPHGFCSGVARAVETAEALLAAVRGEPVYCLNEIVHNRQVVERLAGLGMVFVDSVEAAPEGAFLLFSAHGVAPSVTRRAAARRLRVVDATCPFVMKVHAEVRRFATQGAYVVCIGHRRHEEVVGVAGEAPEHVRIVESAEEAEALEVPADAQVAVVTQTTLGGAQVESVMAVLRRRFPGLWLPAATDVCYATRNRQRAVRMLAEACPRVLVLGSANSSNSLRLVETARAAGAEAELVSGLAQIDRLALAGAAVVGVASGASTPESFLDAAIEALRERHGFSEPDWLTAVEEDSPVFKLPEMPTV